MGGKDDKRVYEEILLREAKMEFLKDSPILKFFNARMFLSYSKGRSKKRKFPCYVILLKVKSKKKWIFWNGNGNLIQDKYLWDKWATEIFGENFCSHLSENPGEYLKNQLLSLLEKNKRF